MINQSNKVNIYFLKERHVKGKYHCSKTDVLCVEQKSQNMGKQKQIKNHL